MPPCGRFYLCALGVGMAGKETSFVGQVREDCRRIVRRELRKSVGTPATREASGVGSSGGSVIAPPPDPDAEPYLGLPAEDGQVLHGDLDGTRYWATVNANVTLAIRRAWIGI